MKQVLEFMGLGELPLNIPLKELKHHPRLGDVYQQLVEESTETMHAQNKLATDPNVANLAEYVDGLLDVIFVAYTGLLSVLPLEAAESCWREVCEANLSKVNGSLGPKGLVNGKIVKPEGFLPPDLETIIQESL